MHITDKKIVDTYFKALLDRNPAFENEYYAGVKTTAIFCISTCIARKPKYENVEFFTELNDVLKNGYRACKICKPI